MKKAHLLGMAQTPKQSVFQLEKKKEALYALQQFFLALQFASWEISKLLAPIGGKDTGKPTIKYSNTLYDDKYFAFQKGQYTMQVFFGKKKVILSILHESDAQQALKEIILRFCTYEEKKEL